MLEKLIRKKLVEGTNNCAFKKAFTPPGFAIVCLKNFPRELATEIKEKKYE